jgi:S-formylglutathione hydrolase FrmB
VLGAVVIALASCSGGSKKSPTTNVTTAASTPTGSSASLTESYRQRCDASLRATLPPVTKGKSSLRELRLRSPDSSRRLRQVFVYRPAGAVDISRLPILYYLHGLPGSASGFWTSGNGKQLLDAQFARGAAPFEVVTLDGNGTKHPDTEWADSIDGTDKVESFLLDTVIPAVEGNHRRDACHRAIAGFSMGGYGAMNLAQRHPDTFGQVAAIAGYFHIDDPDRVFGGQAAVERANSPDQQVSRARGLRVFLLDAGQERLKLVKGEAERFARLLIAHKIPVTLEYAPGSHNGAYAFGRQPAISAFLESGWVAGGG